MSKPSLAAITSFPCIAHRTQQVTYICTDFRCNNNPYLCPQCFSANIPKSNHSNHEQSLLPISDSIPDLAMIIQACKQQMAHIFQSTMARKEYDPLLQRLDGGQRHYSQIDSHISNIKKQLERSTETLCLEFQRRVQASKQNIYAQLDNYQKQYVQNMEAYKTLIEPLFSFNRRFKLYSNPNNISLKLLSELKHKSAEWYTELKKTMGQVTKMIERPQATVEHIQKSTEYLLGLGDENLPQFVQTEANTEFRNMNMQLYVNELLREFVLIKEQPKNINFSPQNDSTIHDGLSFISEKSKIGAATGSVNREGGRITVIKKPSEWTSTV